MRKLFLFTFITSFYCHADIISVTPDSVEKISRISISEILVPNQAGQAASQYKTVKFQIKLKDKDPLKFCFSYNSGGDHYALYPYYELLVINFVKTAVRSSQQLVKQSKNDSGRCQTENMNIVWIPDSEDPTCSYPKFSVEYVDFKCK